jgi:hypothetical protein
MHLKLSSALRVVLYFTHNPDDELLTADIALKFNMPVGDVPRRLRAARNIGLLKTRTRDGKKLNGPGQGLLWAAGPKILNMIERNTW